MKLRYSFRFHIKKWSLCSVLDVFFFWGGGGGRGPYPSCQRCQRVGRCSPNRRNLATSGLPFWILNYLPEVKSDGRLQKQRFKRLSKEFYLFHYYIKWFAFMSESGEFSNFAKNCNIFQVLSPVDLENIDLNSRKLAQHKVHWRTYAPSAYQFSWF